MPQPLSGPGLGLSLPQQLYPANLTNGEVTTPCNQFTLAPGEALPIPAGRWLVTPGKYCSVQYLDPVTTAWTLIRDNLTDYGGALQIWSDGFNVRVANLTGCVVGATVTNGGTAYVAGSTTITPSTGNSTWAAVVGGAVATSGGTSITAVGAGYGVAPLVFVDAPPAPGVQATAVANISGGTVTSLTWVNQGAGYTTAPNITILTNPADPNLLAGTSITAATAVASLTGSGNITAAILTNSGAPVASSMTLTVTGAGTTATVVPLFLETTTAVTSVSGGAGYGTFTQLTTIGGFNTNTPALTNPSINLRDFLPRPAQIGLALSGTAIASATTIYDGGLYLNSASPVPVTNGVITTAASLTITAGSVNDTVRIQQLA